MVNQSEIMSSGKWNKFVMRRFKTPNSDLACSGNYACIYELLRADKNLPGHKPYKTVEYPLMYPK